MKIAIFLKILQNSTVHSFPPAIVGAVILLKWVGIHDLLIFSAILVGVLSPIWFHL